MDQLTTVGVDLAKDVFAICVLDATGAVLQRRVLRREASVRVVSVALIVISSSRYICKFESGLQPTALAQETRVVLRAIVNVGRDFARVIAAQMAITGFLAAHLVVALETRDRSGEERASRVKR